MGVEFHGLGRSKFHIIYIYSKDILTLNYFPEFETPRMDYTLLLLTLPVPASAQDKPRMVMSQASYPLQDIRKPQGRIFKTTENFHRSVILHQDDI